MTEPPGPGDEGVGLVPVRIVPQDVADQLIDAALETIAALQRELGAARRVASHVDPGLDAEADFLIEQARALVAEAEAHRARVLAVARAEATATLEAAPASRNGQP